MIFVLVPFRSTERVEFVFVVTCLMKLRKLEAGGFQVMTRLNYQPWLAGGNSLELGAILDELD